ncbi:MAG: hypothetical protein OXC53_11925, partial [Rhodobacteraceae bacterium]|nr:hypothetical protein [Paracoccaceae bacterium]
GIFVFVGDRICLAISLTAGINHDMSEFVSETPRLCRNLVSLIPHAGNRTLSVLGARLDKIPC